MRSVLVIAWFAMCGLAAAPTAYYGLNGGSILFTYIMLVLTFPSGLLYWAVVAGGAYLGLDIVQAGPTDAAVAAIGHVVVFVGFPLVGYFQWFKLVPYIVQVSKGRRAHET